MVEEIDSIQEIPPERANRLTSSTSAFEFFEGGKHKVVKWRENNEDLETRTAEEYQILKSIFGDQIPNAEFIKDDQYFGVISDYFGADGVLDHFLHYCFHWTDDREKSGTINLPVVMKLIKYLQHPKRLKQMKQFMVGVRMLQEQYGKVLDFNGRLNISFDKSNQLKYIDSFNALFNPSQSLITDIELLEIATNSAESRGLISTEDIERLQHMKRQQPPVRSGTITRLHNSKIDKIIFIVFDWEKRLKQKTRAILRQEYRRRMSQVFSGRF